jgi:hypothetical protein
MEKTVLLFGLLEESIILLDLWNLAISVDVIFKLGVLEVQSNIAKMQNRTTMLSLL